MSALAIALQEWAAICALLVTGRLVLLVRKGGIHERGGRFTLEHERFLLLPTFVHQAAERLRPGIPVPADPAPGRHRLELWAEVAALWRVQQRSRLDALALPWSDAELDARFAYREPGLWAVALRVHRLPAAAELPDHPSYGGCRSWIRLREAIETVGSRPVLEDAAFAAELERCRRALGDPG